MSLSRPLTLGVTVAVALLAVWAIGRASASQSERDAIVSQAQANATIALRAYRGTRDSIPALTAQRVAAEAVVRNLRSTAARVDTVAVAVSDSSRAVLADSAATVPVLRAALQSQVLVTDSLGAAFRRYVTADVTADAARTAERVVLLSALSKADTALAASQRVSEAYRLAGRCRVLWMPCPTRTQSFVAGAVVTAGVIIGLRR